MTANANDMFSDTYRYDSIVVAFFIVAWANLHKFSINLTKTQKLLYIAYGANLVIGKNRLCGEHPQAWPYGPVFPATRTRLLKTDIPGITMDDPLLAKVKDDEYLKSIIQFVFKGFGDKTAGQLTAWSHRPNSAWDETTHMPNFRWGNEIPDAYIYEYFAQMINFLNPDDAKPANPSC